MTQNPYLSDMCHMGLDSGPPLSLFLFTSSHLCQQAPLIEHVLVSLSSPGLC